MRYDACIIGAGAEGLAAAAALAGRGLKTVVVERDTHCGGRCATREFHPGFHASPFVDELPAIPADIFWSLDLARRGVVLAPASVSLAAWPGGTSLFLPWADASRIAVPVEALRVAIRDRVTADAAAPPRRAWFARRAPKISWPGEKLAAGTLAGVLSELSSDDRDHRAASVLAGQACDIFAAGSALHLLAGAGGGMPAGGLGRLGEALRAAAEDAGAEIRCGLEVADIRRRSGRAVGVGLADGSDVATRAVISTLDLKRTFLSLFSWSDLPRAVVDRVGAFRPAPGVARLLLALDAPPSPPAGTDAAVLRGPIYGASDALEEAYRAWRRGAVPERPPMALRVVSAVDPSLAPDGAACMTVTLGAIPHAPFDGAWTHDKRDRLRDSALAALETILPGTAKHVTAAELIVPPDIENLLGVTAGDLAGGEIAADQMLGFRPFADCAGMRTPVEGLYLAGSSSALGPLTTCASGFAAARALLADFAAGRLR
ncbi:MAG: NAD(P)/FAD-dependent oxidoreductase [Alphaproteobacteria bacterium]|nr:NAD(P)/FAD-dependent oxidoreductase [Alphaproteobacteria bacterium]MDE2495727.1 NAD(P)/FAD-dependent oxidoreductase [Alphaproteobacteria bacterium]